jgi:hypothetical protein
VGLEWREPQAPERCREPGQDEEYAPEQDHRADPRATPRRPRVC